MTLITESLSKRKTLADKYRVEKRVKAKHKKDKKMEKKNPLWKSTHKLKKDPGVPNLYPFKEKLMTMMKDDHELERAGKERIRKEAQSLKQLASNANTSEAQFEKRIQQEGAKGGPESLGLRDNSRKAFYREFKRVVEESDVLLEVLDARDPNSCRARAVEQAILEKGGKKIVLVLNKIDLVPQEVVQAWLTHLRHEFPTVAFRCNTQTQNSHLARSKGDFDTYDSLAGGACLGGDNLLELLKNYCRSQNLKKSLTVGIIGYPNTGKSSLINSLKRSRAAAVGARPGFTRTMQEVKLDANLVLLDCPGIVFSDVESNANNSADVVLRNAVEMDKIKDPVPLVDSVLRRCTRERLMELYRIPSYSSADEFLAHVSHRIGKLKRGGVPDYRAAAVSVLRDWQSGKIKFYTLPPEKSDAILASEVVSQWAKEFDVSSVISKEQASVLPKLRNAKQLKGETLLFNGGSGRAEANDFVMEALGQVAMADHSDKDDEEEQQEEEEEEDAMELESDESSSEDNEDPYALGSAAGGMVVDVVSKKPMAGVKKRASALVDDYVPPVSAKKTQKKMLKRQRKGKQVPMEAEEFHDEAYNFEEDFVVTKRAEREPSPENYDHFVV